MLPCRRLVVPDRGGAMSDNAVTLAGNLAADPELRFTPNGVRVASFRLAVAPRIREAGAWRNGEPSVFRINAWRELAVNVAESLDKGDRAVVVGRLRARVWETPAGEQRSVVEVEADEVGVSLRRATARPERVGEWAAAT
jgi:single-strand DNA-binding protein